MNDDLVKCAKCGNETNPLAVFPGGICLECYRPEGDKLAATMTGEKLAAMWGADMNGYVALYNGNRLELYAKTLWEAKQKAIAHWKVPRSKHWMVTTMLAEKNGQPVTHVAVD